MSVERDCWLDEMRFLGSPLRVEPLSQRPSRCPPRARLMRLAEGDNGDDMMELRRHLETCASCTSAYDFFVSAPDDCDIFPEEEVSIMIPHPSTAVQGGQREPGTRYQEYEARVLGRQPDCPPREKLLALVQGLSLHEERAYLLKHTRECRYCRHTSDAYGRLLGRKPEDWRDTAHTIVTMVLEGRIQEALELLRSILPLLLEELELGNKPDLANQLVQALQELATDRSSPEPLSLWASLSKVIPDLTAEAGTGLLARTDWNRALERSTFRAALQQHQPEKTSRLLAFWEVASNKARSAEELEAVRHLDHSDDVAVEAYCDQVTEAARNQARRLARFMGVSLTSGPGEGLV